MYFPSPSLEGQAKLALKSALVRLGRNDAELTCGERRQAGRRMIEYVAGIHAYLDAFRFADPECLADSDIQGPVPEI